MFTIREYVPATEVWPNSKFYIDKGYKSGLVRGYNIEVITASGSAEWLSCTFIHDDPEKYFNNDFNKWYFKEHRWTPTGRVCFRGYGREEYCIEERDTFIIPVEVI